MNTHESLPEIGASIKKHRSMETGNYARVLAVGRANCTIKNKMHPDRNGTGLYWLTNKELYNGNPYKGDGMPIYKNTKLGEVLTKYHSGTHEYSVTTKLRKVNDVKVSIHNRATYSLTPNSAKEITIYNDDNNKAYHFQNLPDLISQRDELEYKLAALRKKQEEERKARQEASRKAAEEKKRQLEQLAAEEAERKRKEAEEAERKRKEEEERRRQQEQAEIEELERKVAEANENIKVTRSFIRQGDQLRAQHLLDLEQEDAKRSHLYDGVPVVIDGGPGTGKTTTMIQRLKFLISKMSLEEYDTPLSSKQIDAITNPLSRNQNWLFFSPTQQLLSFLRQNMVEEELTANDQNTTILDLFSKKILLDYKLRVPETDGPFKLYKIKSPSEEIVIKDAHAAVLSFQHYIINNIAKILKETCDIPTTGFSWNRLATEIKSYCQRVDGVKDLEGIIRLLNSLHDNENNKVRVVEKELNDELKVKALQIKNKVLADEAMQNKAKALFEEWRRETIVVQDVDADEEEMDESDEEEANANMSQLDFDTKLFQQIKPILRKIGLKEYDSKQKLSKRQQDLFNIIRPVVEETPLGSIGSLAWFSKKFAFLCKGVEQNLLNQIPRLYKLYRKDQIKRGSTAYDLKILSNIDKKDGGKRLHREELELIVGTINRIILSIYKKSKTRFEAMRKNKFVDAYCGNVKPVIGVDEATDYTVIDYYFISSFLHYEYSSLTLCGDIMQGLNAHGIKSWDELKAHLFPNMEVVELKRSYRQLPTLVEMSKQIYKDTLGVSPTYDTTIERQEIEPTPIYFVSDDMEEKAEWMAKRIIEVMNFYDGTIPSIAILVGDEVNIRELVDEINDQDYLNGIQIYDCSEGRTATSKNAVKVYRLSEVKGMEFEVAFFYDIDEALAGQSIDMMRRYLYVGISRASSHLAATFTKREGNEEIIKYFDSSKDNWKL